MTTPLIEAMARAMYSEVHREPGNVLTAKGAMHISQAALTAITEAGYEIVHKNYRGDGAYHKAMNAKFYQMANAAQGDG